MWWNTLGLARRGDHADEARQVRQQLRRVARSRAAAGRACSCALDRRSSSCARQRRRLRRQHGVDEQAVAARGRARGRRWCAGWRSGPSSSRSAITLRIVAGDSSRPAGARERARADRLAVGDVALDQGLQQGLGALVEHRFESPVARRDFASRRRGSLWCNPAHGDPLPARCARRQVPGRRASATMLEDDRRSSSSRRASRCRSSTTPPLNTGIAGYAALRADELGASLRPRRRRRRRRHHARHRPPARAPRHAAGRHQPGPARLHHRHRRSATSQTALAPMLAGDYEDEKRHDARGRRRARRQARSSQGFALNDVVVSRGATASMVELRVDDRRRLRRQPARRRR